VRKEPDLHRDLAVAAERAGESINAFVVACLEREIGARRERGTRVGVEAV
jgi:predicted HicB family RNase H-like nuclease